MLRSILLSAICSGSLFFSACNTSDYSTASDKDTTVINTTTAATTATAAATVNAGTPASTAVKDTVPVVNPPVVGNDADQHGCRASAGYNWSALRNDCVRIFESGIRLMPQDPSLNKTLAAFVIFKSDTDDSKAELYIPGKPGSIIFDRTKEKDAAGTWTSGTMKLTQWKGMYTLEDGKKTLYQGPAVR